MPVLFPKDLNRYLFTFLDSKSLSKMRCLSKEDKNDADSIPENLFVRQLKNKSDFQCRDTSVENMKRVLKRINELENQSPEELYKLINEGQEDAYLILSTISLLTILMKKVLPLEKNRTKTQYNLGRDAPIYPQTIWNILKQTKNLNLVKAFFSFSKASDHVLSLTSRLCLPLQLEKVIQCFNDPKLKDVILKKEIVQNDTKLKERLSMIIVENEENHDKEARSSLK